MTVIERTAAAKRDVREIWRYIARDDETAADAFLTRVDAKLMMLSAEPLVGRLRPELRPALRSFVVGNYVVFYVPIPDGIRLIRLLHGARDLKVVFGR